MPGRLDLFGELAHGLLAMGLRLSLPILTACLLFNGALQAREQSPAKTLLHDFVLPQESELSWRAIPWLDSFAAGVLAADHRDLPVLLWAMNGHPLGCT